MGAVFAPVAMGLQVASGVFGAVQSMQQGEAGAAAAISEGQQALAAGKLEANVAAAAYGDQIREGRRFAGQQRAAFATTGATPSGSITDIAAQTRSDYEQDALNQLYRGQVAMVNAGNAWKFAKTRAKMARWQGVQGAFSSILNSVAGAANTGMSAYGGAFSQSAGTPTGSVAPRAWPRRSY